MKPAKKTDTTTMSTHELSEDQRIVSKNTDIVRQSTLVSNDLEYFIDDMNYQGSPEDFLLAKEEAVLSGEDFESHPLQAMDFGYKTPCTSEELIESFAVKTLKSEENRIFNRIETTREVLFLERKWVKLIQERNDRLAELLPRLETMYAKNAA